MKHSIEKAACIMIAFACIMGAMMLAMSCERSHVASETVDARSPEGQPKTKAEFSFRSTNFQEIAPFMDVRFSAYTGNDSVDEKTMEGLTFNRLTTWNESSRKIADEIAELGMNPGLGVRALHERGITGKGIAVAIIDQNLAGEHPEFAGRLVSYTDLGCGAGPDSGSMHAPAVASLLAGKRIGTAPDADVYFYAMPTWKSDGSEFITALKDIMERNRTLAPAKRIRVVSISAAPGEPGSPFEKIGEEWARTTAKALEENILVLDCTRAHGFVMAGYFDLRDPDNFAKFEVGWPDSQDRIPMNGYIFAPTSRRTVAEEYVAGESSYQYYGVGGLSWAIPYVAGVCALGWQVNPEVSAAEMKTLLFNSARVIPSGARVIDAARLVEIVNLPIETSEETAPVDEKTAIARLRRDSPWIPEDTKITRNDDGTWKIEDNVNRPFVDDPAILGVWTVCDMVSDPKDFDPGHTRAAKELFWMKVEILKGGNAVSSSRNSVSDRDRWTKDYFLSLSAQIPGAERYEIAKIDGTDYLFIEWKSGDYTVRANKPYWYVFTR